MNQQNNCSKHKEVKSVHQIFKAGETVYMCEECHADFLVNLISTTEADLKEVLVDQLKLLSFEQIADIITNIKNKKMEEVRDSKYLFAPTIHLSDAAITKGISNGFIEYMQRAQKALPGDGEQTKISKDYPLFLRPTTDLELTPRAINCLKSQSINRIGDLVIRSEYELSRFSNLGKITLNQIKEALRKYNLSLGMKIENWATELKR